MSKTETTVRVIGSGAAALAGTVGIAQAQDFAGFYGGVGVSMPSGEQTLPFGPTYSLDGSAVGSVFAGYNLVSQGGLVYGAELAVTQGSDFDMGGPYGGFGQSTNYMVDLKGRLGKVFGTTLAYGSLGYSFSSIMWPGSTDAMAKVGGVNFGAGFEVPISANGFIGGDVTQRFLGPWGTNAFGDPSSNYVDSLNMTTISVRLGFRF